MKDGWELRDKPLVVIVEEAQAAFHMTKNITILGMYAAGNASVIMPAQLIIAAASGLRAAGGVNTDLIQSEFCSSQFR